MNNTRPTPESVGATRFRDSWRNWLRITTVRIIVQAITFGLFVAFVLLTTFTNLSQSPGLRDWVSKLLEIDPLVSIAAAITTHTVYKGLLWSLVILVPTLFLGRFFCNWVCPYGTLHHFVGWLFRAPTEGARTDSRTSGDGSPAHESDVAAGASPAVTHAANSSAGEAPAATRNRRNACQTVDV